MDYQKLRERLEALPKRPWRTVVGKKENAVDPQYRIDVFSGEEVKTLKTRNMSNTYTQIFHYHGQNNSLSAAGIEWMKKNPRAKETIEFIAEMPDIIDALLKELGY